MPQILIEPIAFIKNKYKEKFGIPRQSNLVDSTISTIVFEEKYRDENSLRGLSEYSHIWLIWQFDKAKSKKDWFPTVRPPRLGGNERVGVFATRSPYHPNGLGISCVQLINIEKDSKFGFVLKIKGADLLDNTPIIDIKPYLSFTDSFPDAKCGFADNVIDYKLQVEFDEKFKSVISYDEYKELLGILSQDPRPSYHNDKNRVYKMSYSDYEISFKVDKMNLTVIDITKGCEQ